MFGSFRTLFAALGRLADAINRAAQIFETANTVLEDRLAIPMDEPRALPATGNGRRVTKHAGGGQSEQ